MLYLMTEPNHLMHLFFQFQQVEDFLKIATYLTITYLTIISVLSTYKSAYTRSRLVLILFHEWQSNSKRVPVKKLKKKGRKEDETKIKKRKISKTNMENEKERDREEGIFFETRRILCLRIKSTNSVAS